MKELVGQCFQPVCFRIGQPGTADLLGRQRIVVTVFAATPLEGIPTPLFPTSPPLSGATKDKSSYEAQATLPHPDRLSVGDKERDEVYSLQSLALGPTLNLTLARLHLIAVAEPTSLSGWMSRRGGINWVLATLCVVGRSHFEADMSAK